MPAEKQHPENEHTEEKEQAEPEEQGEKAAEEPGASEIRSVVGLREFGAFRQQPGGVALAPTEPDQAEPGCGQQAEQHNGDHR